MTLESIEARLEKKWRETQPPERPLEYGELCPIHNKAESMTFRGCVDWWCPDCRKFHNDLRGVYARSDGDQAAEDCSLLLAVAKAAKPAIDWYKDPRAVPWYLKPLADALDALEKGE